MYCNCSEKPERCFVSALSEWSFADSGFNESQTSPMKKCVLPNHLPSYECSSPCELEVTREETAVIATWN